MANHASAIKRARQNKKRNERNKEIKATAKNKIKKTKALIAKGSDAKVIATELAGSMKEVYKAVSKGVLKKKTAARYISRLSKQAAKKAK